MKYIAIISVWILWIGCSGSKHSQTGFIEDQNTMTLLDHIHSLPGLVVSGDGPSARIRVRGINSLSGVNSPLFILDGNDMGYEFSSVHGQVSANNIRSVRLLKEPSETGIYGMRGANGVIVIRTRGTNDGYGK